MVTRKKLDDEIVLRREMLKNNYSRASAYYKSAFKDCYKEVVIRGEEISRYMYKRYALDKTEYVFHKFDLLSIGENVALSHMDYTKIEAIRFIACEFKNCKFQNMIFKNCRFNGCQFVNVNFDHVIFDNCMFTIPVIENAMDANGTFYATTTFQKCIFVGEFKECDLDNVLFEKCNFTVSKFRDSSLQKAVFYACAICGGEIQDCTLQGMAIGRTDILDITFTDERNSSVDENTLIDYRIISKRKDSNKKKEAEWIPGNFDDLCLKKSQSLRGFSRLFGLNGYPDLEGEMFYFTKKIELKALHSLKKIKSVIALILCGYGERPSFTFYTMIVSILLFGIIYMFAGIQIGDGIPNIRYPLNKTSGVKQIMGDFGRCIFFSLTTFSTVGYGNYVPLGPVGMIVSGVQMIWGVSLCALWTGCILRKIAR